MTTKSDMLEMASRLRATVSESKRHMLDEAAQMLEDAAGQQHEILSRVRRTHGLGGEA